VINKREIYGSQKCEFSDDEGEERKGVDVWHRPRKDEVKMIDFGGATYEHDHHT
jgi:hypothetical protein